MLTYYYFEFYKKTLEREDELLFFCGVTRSIGELFGEDLHENETFPKEKFYRVMILCLDLYKRDRDKGSNTIYSTIKKEFLFYIGTT